MAVQLANGLVSVPGLSYGWPRVVCDQIAHLFASRQNTLSGGDVYGTKDADGDTIVSDYEDNDLNNWGSKRPL